MNTIFLRFIFLFFVINITLVADEDYKKQLADVRVKYVQSILKDDKKNEILYLKKVIEYSDKLGETTSILKKDLQRLEDQFDEILSKETSINKKVDAQKKEILIKKDENLKKVKVLPIDDLPKQAINANGKVIVIDAGHGGKDVGAVGQNGEQEKDCNLEIALTLYDILKSRGYSAYLTRDDDTFIELKDRTKIANDKDAKIFVSIHANAVPSGKSRDVRGIETYFLSPAKDEKAKRIASLENGMDMNDMNQLGKDVFLDVFNRGKITQSHKLAIDVQRNLKYQATTLHSDIVDGGVREAPFWVLVGAQMPAILVETGYISNNDEAKRLFDSNYQKKIALGVADGINSYFVHNQ